MKKIIRTVSVLLLFAMLLGSVISIAGETTKITKDVYKYSDSPVPDEAGIISDMNAFLPNDGYKVSWLSNHGGGQTRMLNTKSGVYFGLFTGEDADASVIGINLFHLKEDGTAESVYETSMPYTGSGPMVSIMADKAGNVWMFSGWQIETNTLVKFQFLLNMWKYDPTTGTTEQFSEMKPYKTKKVVNFGGGGYAVTSIDEENGRIFALVNCYDKPGFMEWSLFDMNTCQWSDMHAVDIDYRYCYSYILPDGNGGFHIFNQRDVKTTTIKTDFGKTVDQTARSTHTSWYENNMLFDEWDYFHIANAEVDELAEQVKVEPAVYEYAKGLYPDFRADSSDVFMDSKGYLHFIYEANENIEYGERVVHVVYDVSSGSLVEVNRQQFEFAATSNAPYFGRFYEDTEGNFYVVAIRSVSTPMEIEIWGSSDPTKDLTLLYAESNDYPGLQVAGTAVASSRNGSIMSDIMHLGVYSYEIKWYYFTIDFAKLRAFLGR